MGKLIGSFGMGVCFPPTLAHTSARVISRSTSFDFSHIFHSLLPSVLALFGNYIVVLVWGVV